MRILSLLTHFLIVALLAACGGGGGSPGIVPGQATTSKVNLPVLSLGLQDAAGASTTSISASANTLLKITLTDPSGRPLANQLIDVAGDATKVSFPDGNTALTNAAGVAMVKLARASLSASGAGLLTATYNFKAGTFVLFPDGSTPPAVDTVVTASVGYQLLAANITLANLDVGTAPLAAYGTRQISVQTNINGVPATATPLQVSFTANCGRISPATATTNSSAIATVSYTAADLTGATTSTQGCGGRSVEITASIPGGAVLTRSLTVLSAPATNMTFVSVSPTRIFLANSGGPTQAIAQFKLVNAVGEGLPGQAVQLRLKTLDGDIPKVTLGTLGNTAPVTLTTDASGVVSVAVFSGTVPTNVVINAALVSNPAVQTDSSILAIASGRAAQARASISLEKFALEGANIDGQLTNVTLSLADRQGNPVPDGTAVNFVTEGGVMIPPVCNTGGVRDAVTGVFSSPGDSRCTVQLRSQNPRPGNGRVSILAYVSGEEDFVDANFNNVYDCGEAFTDLGTAFRDDNENGVFDTGEFSVPIGASSSQCGAGVQPTPQAGDRVWGAADVRKQAIAIFATSQAVISGTFQQPVIVSVTEGTTTTSFAEFVGIDVVVADLNGNSVPTGSVITFTALDRTSDKNSCTIVGASSVTVPNTLAPLAVTPAFKGCRNGDVINVTITTPGGTATTRAFNVPF